MTGAYTTRFCAAPGLVYSTGAWAAQAVSALQSYVLYLEVSTPQGHGAACGRVWTTGAWAALELSTLQKPVLHPDVSTHGGMSCTGTVYTTEACATPVCTQGSELHWNCLHYIGLCFTRACLHTGIWAALELSTLHKPVLHPDVSTHWGMSCTGTVYTTEACAAPGHVYTLGYEMHWNCLHYRGLCCTRTCLHTGVWAAQKVSTLHRPVLHPNLSTHRGMKCTGTVYTTEACAFLKYRYINYRLSLSNHCFFILIELYFIDYRTWELRKYRLIYSVSNHGKRTVNLSVSILRKIMECPPLYIYYSTPK